MVEAVDDGNSAMSLSTMFNPSGSSSLIILVSCLSIEWMVVSFSFSCCSDMFLLMEIYCSCLADCALRVVNCYVCCWRS